MSEKKKVTHIHQKERDLEEARREAKLFAEVLMQERPSKEACDYFDEKLQVNPEAWRTSGDLIAVAQRDYLKSYGSYARRKSVEHGAELLRQDLGYESSTALERVLIDHIILCHIRLGLMEIHYSQKLSGSYTLDVAAHLEMRLTLAHRRFVRATEALARTRRLLARVQPKSEQEEQKPQRRLRAVGGKS